MIKISQHWQMDIKIKLFFFQCVNFDLEQEGMKKQLIDLNKLLQVTDPKLYSYLRKYPGLFYHSVQRGLKPTLFIFIPPFISNHTFCKNKHTHPFADHVFKI